MVCFCSLDHVDQIPHEQLVHVQTHALHAVGWTPDNIPQEFARMPLRELLLRITIYMYLVPFAQERVAQHACVFLPCWVWPLTITA